MSRIRNWLRSEFPLLLLKFARNPLGWVKTRRDIVLLIFSGFLAVYIVTTATGTVFRGQGQELRPPWDIVVVE